MSRCSFLIGAGRVFISAMHLIAFKRLRDSKNLISKGRSSIFVHEEDFDLKRRQLEHNWHPHNWL
jgi:hypothetical protein